MIKQILSLKYVSLTRKTSLYSGDLVKNRLGFYVELTAEPRQAPVGSKYDPGNKNQNVVESYVGALTPDAFAIVVVIYGTGTLQSVYVITPDGSGWISSAHIEFVTSDH